LITGGYDRLHSTSRRLLVKEQAVSDEDWFRFFETDVLSGVSEIAAMIAYVCSVPASATTGAVLRFDGGVVRAIARGAVRSPSCRTS